MSNYPFNNVDAATPIYGNPEEYVSSLTVLNTQGVTVVVGTPTVTVRRISNSGHVQECTSTSAPTNGDAGYFPGCFYTNTAGGAGSIIYVNQGTTTSAIWAAFDNTGSNVPTAVNSTATLTAAQVLSGYITSTSAAATTMTLPTGSLLGAAINAVQGTTFELFIDNTAGANTVTMAVATNGIKSDAANTTAASFGQLTIASGVTGIGRFTIMFSSPTAYVFTRTA